MDNVRGGSFCEIKLNENNIATLNQMSNGTNNKCFVCGSEEHFAKDCEKDECWETDDSDEYETDDSDEYEEVWCCENCGKEFEEEYKCEYHAKYCNKKSNENVICFRCGREGHYSTSCYASKPVSYTHLTLPTICSV